MISWTVFWADFDAHRALCHAHARVRSMQSLGGTWGTIIVCERCGWQSILLDDAELLDDAHAREIGERRVRAVVQ